MAPAPQKKCKGCGALNHVRKKVCGDCGVCRSFSKFTHIATAAEEDGSSDKEVPTTGAERDDSSSESDDDEGELSNVYLDRNEKDRERNAAARKIIQSNDSGLVPFAPGPRTLASVQTEGVPTVGDIVDSKNNAELRSLEAFEASGGLPARLKTSPKCYLWFVYVAQVEKRK